MGIQDRQAISAEVYSLAASSEPIGECVKEALDVIENALETYPSEEISISFNGGKDCTVLLHLYAAALARRTPLGAKPIPAVYVPVPSPFLELEEFIQESARAYNLDIFTCSPESDAQPPIESSAPGKVIPEREESKEHLRDTGFSGPVGEARGGGGMQYALHLYKEKYPQIEAIFIGTRRSDPHGATLAYRNKTDAGWPTFERINPIINWSYSDVWTFLQRLSVRYCSLYDQGYTSLGSVYNTFPNPALHIQDDPSSDSFPSFTIIADAPNAMCTVERSALSPSKPAAEDRDSTVIESGSACMTDLTDSGCHHTLGPFQVIAHDPSTMCLVDSIALGGNGNSKPPLRSARYKPAYMLQDGSLERAGRVSGTTLLGEA